MRIQVLPESISNARRFYEMSEADLKAAEILFDRGLYFLAIFHMQQSVEKMVKSFLLILGIKTVKEIKKLGHRMPEIWKEILELCEYFHEYIKIMEGWLPEDAVINYMARIETSKNRVKDWSTEAGTKKLLAISRDEKKLKNILMTADKVYQELEQISRRPIKFNRLNEIKIFPTELRQFHALISSLEPKDREHVFNIIFKGVGTGVLSFPHLLSFAIVFYPHSSLSRYPDENWDPASFYTPELPLVKMLPEFFDRMKTKVISNFYSFLSVYQELFFGKRG